MKMFKISAGFELAYRTFGNPEHPAILLLHGNSCSAELFTPQFSSYFNGYFLIATDFIGHGGSGRSENAAHCSMQGLAKSTAELIEVLTEALKVEQLLIYVVSPGGHGAIEMAPLFAGKLRGLMVSGAPPLKIPLNATECFTDSPIGAKAFTKDINAQQRQAWADACVHENNAAKHLLMSWIEKTEPAFRPNFGQSLACGKGVSNQHQIMEEVTIPVALIQGEHEWLINHEYIAQIQPIDFYQNKVHRIPGGAHFPNLENPEAFNTILKDFALYSFEV